MQSLELPMNVLFMCCSVSKEELLKSDWGRNRGQISAFIPGVEIMRGMSEISQCHFQPEPMLQL